MPTKEDIERAQKAIDAASGAIACLDLYGFYDCAWQSNNGYQRIIDYNKEQLEESE